ncbi:hypothetical protein [Algoriphagus namhaensis]
MKKLYQQISTWIKTKLREITPGPFAVKSAALGLLILTGVVFAIEVIGMSINFRDPWILAFGALVILLSILAAYVGVWLLRQLYEIPRVYKLALTISVILLMVTRFNDERIPIFLILVFSLLGASVGILFKGHFRRINWGKKIITVLGLLLGLAGLGSLLYFGMIDGLEMEKQIHAAELTEEQVLPLQADSPAEKGMLDFFTFTYGSGKDLRREEFAEGVTYQTESVDGRMFIDGWNKFAGWWREKYWGFDSRALPINARVWMPEGEGPFPLVLVVHGNHPMQDFSDPGYDYLGEHLASRGIILASVDENFINGSWTDIFGGLEKENDARGWLLLEHLQVWKGWMEDSTHPLYGKADLERISLMGHSRGGEAVGHAAMLNSLEYYPDDASFKLGYHFNIKSVVAIAPVDGQYKPGGSGTAFENVDYLTIHGAQDADVTSFAGAMQFSRIKFTDSLYHFKSAVYISGANHGQFNTSWGDNDILATYKGILNFGQLMPAAEQETVAKVYITAFLEATLKDKKEYLPLFADSRKGRNWLPEAIYLSEFEDSTLEIWADYEEDFELGTLSGNNLASGENLSVWREGQIKMEYGQKGGRAVFLGWNYEDWEPEAELWKDGATPSLPDSVLARYVIRVEDLSPMPDSTAVFTFALAESKESSTPRSGGKWAEETNNESEKSEEEGDGENKVEEEEAETEESESEEETTPDPPLNFTIVLQDGAGAEVSFLLSEFSHLQRQIKSRVLKLDFLDGEDHAESIFQTFRFDLKQLSLRNPQFDLATLREIRFEFDQNESGVVILDQVGLATAFESL